MFRPVAVFDGRRSRHDIFTIFVIIWAEEACDGRWLCGTPMQGLMQGPRYLAQRYHAVSCHTEACPAVFVFSLLQMKFPITTQNCHYALYVRPRQYYC